MNDRDKRSYGSFKRVQTFGDENAGDFAAGSVAVKNFNVIDQVIANLDEAKAGQIVNPDTTMETLLDAVKVDIQNIARTASAIDLEESGFADSFHSLKAYNPAALLTTADAFLEKLAVQTGDSNAIKTEKAALVAKFVAHEIKNDFVAALQADRRAITDGQSNLEANSEDRIGNTAVINPLVRQGKMAVATLDAIMHNKYSGQPDKFAAWISASHVERAPQSKKAPTPPIPKSPEQK